MAANSPITVVNVIELPAEQVDGWRGRADFMRGQAGFRDCTVYRATLPDKLFQLINIAHVSALD